MVNFLRKTLLSINPICFIASLKRWRKLSKRYTPIKAWSVQLWLIMKVIHSYNKKTLKNRIYNAAIPVKSTLENTISVQYAGLMSMLCEKARAAVRELDSSNDVTFLRVRSKKNEILVAPERDYILIVIQNPTD